MPRRFKQIQRLILVTGILANLIVPLLNGYYKINEVLKTGKSTYVEYEEKVNTVYTTMRYMVGVLQIISGLIMLWAIFRLW